MTVSRRRPPGIRFTGWSRLWSAHNFQRQSLCGTGMLPVPFLFLVPVLLQCHRNKQTFVTRRFRMTSDKNTKTALITGASGGIGYELAKLFAKDHHNLVLVARSESKLAQFADDLHRQFGVLVKPVALDLTTADAPQLLFDQLRSEGVVIDVLVNNAGYGKLGAFADVPWEEASGQIQLNITALTHLTKLFLPSMIKKGSGKI